MTAKADSAPARASWQTEAAWLIVASAAFAALFSAVYLYSLSHPPCRICDATVYGTYARAVQVNGLFGDWDPNGLRTYGYPLFLAIVQGGAEWADFALSDPRPAIIQGVLYFGAVLALFIAVRQLDRRLAWCVVAGLLCNPLVIVHLPVRLTEGLIAPIFVLVLAIAVRVSRGGLPLAAMAGLLALGGFLAAYALVIRPAQLGLLIAWLIFAAVVLARGRWPGRFWLAAAALGGVALALGPQIANNVRLWGVFSPLPTYGLADLQAESGVLFLKYTTMLAGGQVATLTYPNTFFDPATVAASPGIGAYLRQPIAGLMTAAAHVFHSLNYDYLLTYTYTRSQWPAAPLNALNHVLLISTAISGSAAVRRAIVRRRVPLEVWWLVAAAVLLTLAINAISAPETRFGLIVFLVAGPLGFSALSRWWRGGRRVLLAAVAAGGCAVALTSALMLPGSALYQPVG